MDILQTPVVETSPKPTDDLRTVRKKTGQCVCIVFMLLYNLYCFAEMTASVTTVTDWDVASQLAAEGAYLRCCCPQAHLEERVFL